MAKSKLMKQIEKTGIWMLNKKELDKITNDAYKLGEKDNLDWVKHVVMVSNDLTKIKERLGLIKRGRQNRARKV